LEAPYKALWIYLLCECDHAGVWTVELDVAQLRMGMKLDTEKALEKMGGAVVPIDGGAKWFLPDFVAFQYGTLNPANRVHESVLAILSKYGIDPNDLSKNKPLTSPLQGAKDKDRDMDIQERKERAKVHEAELWPSFTDFWQAYGKSRGKPVALQLWAKIHQADREAIMAALPAYTAANEKQYRLDPERYLRRRAWEDEVIPRNATTNGKPSNEQLSNDLDRVIAQRYGIA